MPTQSNPTRSPDVPLRGEAAWKAAKQRVADRNEAAYRRGRAERADADARDAERRRDAERKERSELPSQPHLL